ncbi:cation/acetate symporter [Pseudogracilibacillus auburnensis]|uniref:Cation/acetate symporter n=2 Tax=Pseudogracilibacillus auburnensis TaxID=1494959 RepID=A0A2V3VY32_9BACI|nr:cation/acetate symporter [Pseudogracilibacillus auburnensis]
MDTAKLFGIILFGAIIALTMYVTYLASKRTTGTGDFYAAGRSLTGFQNGLAIAGDYLSAASFLGIAGLVALYGYDGFMYSIGWLMGYVIVLYIVAEPFRNSGNFTVADVISYRLKQRPVRTSAAVVTMAITMFYMISQLVGAGAIIHLLVGIPYEVSLIIVGVLMMIYVTLGGMLATSWVQIIKAVLLMSCMLIMLIFIAVLFKFNLSSLFGDVIDKNGMEFLTPGKLYTNPIDLLSLGLTLILGTAGLSHLLVRFFTVPTAQAARSSVVWGMVIIGSFYFVIAIIGFASASLVGEEAINAAGGGGNMAAPLLGQVLGGGAGTIGGEIFMAGISAVAFATIVAVVAGLVITGAGVFAHDIYTNVIKRGEVDQRKQFQVARITAFVIGVVSIILGILAKNFNVAQLVTYAFAVGASSNLPVIIFSIYWKRFNTPGAVAAMLTGTITSVILILLSPNIMGEAAIYPLSNPGIVSIPLGFIAAVVVTLMTKPEDNDKMYAEMSVRSHTGLGAE